MNNLKKFELMEKIGRQLKDLQHSQQAIIEKVGKLEIDNFDLSDKNLEKVLSDMHQRAADSHDNINALLERFSDKTDNFGDKHNVDRLREQKDIDDAAGN